MADNVIIQMEDYAGNNQYPATLASIVYDDNGKTVAERLAALEVLLKMFEWDGEVIKAKASIYSVGQVSASKKGEEGEGGSGAGMMLLTEWDDSITDLSSYALGANLGKGLRDEIAAMKTNPSSYITLKTINNQSLFGSGNIEVKATIGWNDIVGRPTHLSQFTDDVVAGKYLPLTGGTMSGNLAINGYLYANSRIVEKSIMEFHHIDGDFVYLANDKYSGKGDGQGLAMYNNTYWHSLIHSGNVGEYALKNYGNQGAIDFNSTLYGGFQYVSGNSSNAPKYRVLASFRVSDSAWQIAGGRSDNLLQYRGGNGTSDSWADWKTIAFTDSNVASATKLLTPRTIWGQSFDGTGNVDGILYMGGSDVLSKKTNALYIGYGSAVEDALPTYLWGDSIYFLDKGGKTKMLINSSGNVGIGTTEPKEKLHIDGAARANQIKIIDKTDTFYPLTIYNDWYGDTGVKYSLIRLLSSTDNARGGFIRVGVDGAYGRFHSMSFGSVDSSYDTTLHLNASGNVTIGAGDLAGTNAKLAVWGNQRIYRGNVTAEYLDISVADVSVYYNAYDPDGYCHQYFQSNGNTRLFINGYSGNVGIGTTNPTYLLDVAGAGRFTGLASFDAGVKIGTTTLGNTNLGLSINTSFYPSSVGLSLGHSSYRWDNVYANDVYTDKVKIGEATLTWDGVALKVDKPFYSTSQVSAGAKAVEAQVVIAPLELTSKPTASTTTEYTDADIASQYGLTTEVLDNLARGTYTRVTYKSIIESLVWSYEVYYVGESKTIILRNGTGSTYNSRNYKFERDSTTGKWKITNA